MQKRNSFGKIFAHTLDWVENQEGRSFFEWKLLLQIIHTWLFVQTQKRLECSLRQYFGEREIPVSNAFEIIVNRYGVVNGSAGSISYSKRNKMLSKPLSNECTLDYFFQADSFRVCLLPQRDLFSTPTPFIHWCFFERNNCDPIFHQLDGRPTLCSRNNSRWINWLKLELREFKALQCKIDPFALCVVIYYMGAHCRLCVITRAAIFHAIKKSFAEWAAAFTARVSAFHCFWLIIFQLNSEPLVDLFAHKECRNMNAV
jgi:hypothetical protein